MKKNVVRILALVLVGLLFLSLLPLVSFADWCAHDHQTTQIIEPVCGDDGYEAVVCEDCGEILWWDVIPHTEEHDFSACIQDDDYLISYGDCEYPTIYYKACTKCGHIAESAYYAALEQTQQDLWEQYNREVAYYGAPVSDWDSIIAQATEDVQNQYTFKVGGDGHHFYEVERQPATCLNDGWEAYRVCEVCGEVEGYQAIPAKGHRFGEFEVVKEPTCTETGLKRRVCEVCGEFEDEVVPALGHQGEFATVKAPTCTEPGSEKRVCTVCGAEEVREIPALGHSGAFTVTKEATCTESGVQERDCAVCGAHETETIPAAHKYGDDNLCVFCGQQNPDAAAYSLSVSNAAVYGSAEDGDGNENALLGEGGSGTETAVLTLAAAPAVEGEGSENTQPGEGGNENTQPGEGGVNIDVSVGDTTTYGTGEYYVTVSLSAEEQAYNDGRGYKNIALVGQTLRATSDPNPDGLIYYWIRESESGAESEILSNGQLVTGQTYTLTNADLNGTVRAAVKEPGSSKEAGRSDSVRVRAEVTINIETRGEGIMQITCARLGEETQTGVLPNDFNWDFVFLTKDVVTLSMEPNTVNQYLFRRIASASANSSSWTVLRDVSNPTDYSFTVSTSSPKRFLLQADKSNLYNEEMPTKGVDSDIYTSGAAKNALTNLQKSIAAGKGVPEGNVKAGTIKYVTPIWFSDAIAMTKAEIKAATNAGFIDPFDVPFPDGLDDTALIMVYHYNVTTGEWELVSESNWEAVQVGGKYVARISGFTDFSPFVVVGLEQVKVSLIADNGTSESDTVYVVKGSEYNAPACSFTAPKDKAFRYWTGAPTGSTTQPDIYYPGDPVPENLLKLDEDFTLTAYWVEGHTVTFDKNNTSATGTMDPLFVPGDTEKALTANAFTLNNHEFTKWNTEPDGSGYSYLNLEVINTAEDPLTDDLTLYAQWNRVQSTVYFDANGGSGSMSEKPGKLGEKLTLTPNAFKNGDKLFSGWATADDKTVVKYTDGQTIDVPAEDLTLYAVWDYKVTVHFDPSNGTVSGTGTMADQTVPGEKTFKLNANTYKAPSTMYDFIGWNEAQTAGTAQYTDGQEIDGGLKLDTTLYAQWKRNAYTVTYKGNGGTGSMSAQTIPEKGAVAISKNGFTAPYGKAFLGWSENPDAEEKDPTYDPGQKLTFDTLKERDADLVLYAVWRDIVTVSFDKNNENASGTMADQTLMKGETGKLNENKFTPPTGWAFAGWNEKPDGTGDKTYKDKDEITPTGDVKLYAQWERVSYRVSYDANSGTGTMNAQTVPKDGSVEASENKFSAPVGKIFVGWSKTSGQDNPVDYKAGDPITWTDLHKAPYEDLTLYAVWKDKVTIRFSPESDSGTGTGTMADQSAAKGDEVTLNANKFTAPTGMAFGGWNTQKDGAGEKYADSAKLTPTEDMTLYAQWLEDACTVTFYKNDGGDPEETYKQSILKDTATQLDPIKFTTPAGKAFNGWNTKRDGTGTGFKDKATVKVTKDTSLYAQWIDACTITFDPNSADATGTMDPQVVETGKSTALNENTYKRINYSFNGWTTKPDGSGDKYADQGQITAAEDMTLYAAWKQIAYAITYDPNGGGGEQMAQQNVPIGNTATIRDNAYTAKPGEVFAYWQDASDPSVRYDPDQKVTPTRDIALKAYWVEEVEVDYYPGEGSGTFYADKEVPKGVSTSVKSVSDVKFTPPYNATFAYWQDDNGNTYTTTGTFTDPYTRLTAIWAPSCTITYNKNATDAEGVMATQTAPSGVEVTVRDNNFTRSEYIFKYWTKTKSDPYPNKKPEEVSGTDIYKEGDGITVTQDTTLYAQWYKTAISKDAVKITGELTGLDDYAVWGETLTAVVSDPVLKSGFTYTWQVDGVEVKSGSDNTYDVKKSDYGKAIVCVVSHPQATNAVESNTKRVSTYAESTNLTIINNGNPNYPYAECAYIYGVVPGTKYTYNGRPMVVPESADGILRVQLPGTYAFDYVTYYAENWYTVGYEVNTTSASGTVTMKNGSITLTSTTNTNDIKHYGGTIWLVRDGSATDISITMRPASSSYVHWSLNGGTYYSSAVEVSRRLGTINMPMLFAIIFNKSSSSPKTGDMSQLGMWSALCLTSFVGAAGMIGASRKRRKHRK